MKKNFSLKTKILFGYMAIIMIIIVLVIWSINNFMRLNKAIDAIMEENYRSVIAAEEMREAVERQDSAQLIFIFGQEKKALDIFQANKLEFTKNLARAEDNITIEGEENIITTINKEYQEYLSMFLDLRVILEEDNEEMVQNYYLNEIIPQFEDVKSGIRDLLIINQDHMKSAQQNANNNAMQAIYSTIVISIVVVLLALVFGFYISNIIIRPIKELTEKAKDIAEGDLEQTIDISKNDEIGQLASEFNSMSRSLKDYEDMNVNKLISEKSKSDAIVRSISNPLVVTDKKNRIILINPRAEELFELEEDKVIKTHFLEVIKEEDIFSLIDRTLKTGEGQSSSDNNLLSFNRDGKDFYFRVTTNPVLDDNNNTNLVIVLFEDVTHLKEVDQMKSEFVSTVSHEFRTPLTSMNMSASMLLEGNLGKVNEEQVELLEVIKEDCERLNNLVDDLLDLSKIESGKIDLQFNEVDIDRLFDASLRPFKEQANDKGIELMIKGKVDGLKAYGDLNKITWVISNLIGNALRYTDEGDSIKLSAERKGHKIHLSVEDTGAGIPKSYQNKIFDKFMRVGSDKDKDTGSGLGLAISKEIIEAHGGRIWVDSKEGEGSTFTFTLKRPK
ncbi:ATP-binding protein [Halonatronum saccharophilum]|uniref:ATP-binding protein n=1 Tax=Halonatronum saccharophilum TaxID=150060 RepID=UPI000481570D|nr:ATP-binding protein [Halonatronum saccharophilum]